ncbi:potassium-transporting ATPase subunit F [Deinococcus marmoris]|nr:potassium-transporting ATPase subunit F [Deinococcus marmoris]
MANSTSRKTNGAVKSGGAAYAGMNVFLLLLVLALTAYLLYALVRAEKF